VFGFPAVVRFSWQTTKTLIEADGVGVHWADDDANPQQPKVIIRKIYYKNNSEKS
jgi:hypothetical protein